MDSLTQIVLGAAVGEAVLGRKVGNKAMLWGAIAGTIPDLDVVSRFFVDSLTANEWHRGFSHSILFSLLAAPLLGAIAGRLDRKKLATPREWTWLFFMCLFTHPLLDAHTTWGTQLFWPHPYRVAYNNIFVADPLYTIPFLVFTIMALASKRGSRKRARLNNTGLIISTSYMVLTIILKGIGFYQIANSLENQGIVYQELETRPTPFNSILWSANVETEDSFLIGYHSLLDKKENVSFMSFSKNHQLLGPLAADPMVQRLIRLSGERYTISQTNDTLYFNDLRFGLLGLDGDRFVYSYALTHNDNKVIATEQPRTLDKAGPIIRQIFTRLKGI